MASSPPDSLPPKAKAAWLKVRAALPTVGVVAAVVIAGALVWREYFSEASETYGSIFVDSPEIYTRERLVNDRFVEDAWLRRKLRDTDKADFSPTGSAARRESASMQLAVNAEAADGAADAAAPRDVARRDAQALFRSELTYRGDIRNLIIENQLDDRHDLRGNSLYRLKFDASVLPGDNTRANALISVVLQEPPHQTLGEKDLFFTSLDREELNRWRRLFADWLGEIDQSIDQIISDLSYDYEMNRFPREFVNDLFVTMGRCDNYNRGYYNHTVKPLLAENAELSAIKIHIDELRKGLAGCGNTATASLTAAKGGGGSPTTPNDPASAKQLGLENRAAAPPQIQPIAETGQAAGEATDQAEREAEASKQELGSDGGTSAARRLAGRNRRQINMDGEPDEDAVSHHEIINRFAAPRLFKLMFGRGTDGKRSRGKVDQWHFLLPYASLAATYDSDEDPFAVGPAGTNLTAFPVDANGGCGADRAPIPWAPGENGGSSSQSDRFCVSAGSVTVPEFLSTINFTAEDLSTALASVPELKSGLDRVVAGGSDKLRFDVESGLFAFIRDLQRQSSVFSYAVTPKQAVQSLLVDDRSDRSASVAATANGLAGQLGGDRSVGFSGVREQPLVVGYGNALGGHDAQTPGIEFGWFISPPVQGADRAGLQRTQSAAQYALTALVSVPAWWDKIDLTIGTGWVNHEDNLIVPVGRPGETEAPENRTVTIDLPRDLESISTSLFERVADPEVEENKMEPIELTVCRPAAILLPGRRLWRSAVVTLGPQTADEIHVLPNMRGIIAKFDRVEVPSGWSDFSAPHEAPVTVWTSQGSRTLRSLAKISLPPSGTSVFTDNGTCQRNEQQG